MGTSPATTATGSGWPAPATTPAPGRVLNPMRQASRFDPRGDYVRRYVRELAGLDALVIHRPWLLAGRERRALNYPAPIVDIVGDSGPPAAAASGSGSPDRRRS